MLTRFHLALAPTWFALILLHLSPFLLVCSFCGHCFLLLALGLFFSSGLFPAQPPPMVAQTVEIPKVIISRTPSIIQPVGTITPTPMPTPLPETLIRLQPITLSVDEGESFTIEVYIDNAPEGMVGAIFYLKFATDILQVQDMNHEMGGVQIQPGGFLTPGLILNNLVSPQSDNGFSTVTYQEFTSLPVKGNGPLATITFQSIGVGVSQLKFSDAKVYLRSTSANDYFTPFSVATQAGEVIVGPIPTPTFTPTSTATPVSPVQEVTAEPLQIAVPSPLPEPTPEIINVEWPKKMNLGSSSLIRVSFIQPDGQSKFTLLSEEVPPQASNNSFSWGGGNQPTPTLRSNTVGRIVGYYSGPLKDAFGSEYEGFVEAKLAGAAFDVEPVTTGIQSLKQPLITWEWNISPKRPGSHIINLGIEAEWKPINNQTKQAIRRQVWNSALDIQVTEPMVATGQVNVLGLVSVLIGSVLSGPWLFEQFEKSREARRKSRENQPKIEIARD